MQAFLCGGGDQDRTDDLLIANQKKIAFFSVDCHSTN